MKSEHSTYSDDWDLEKPSDIKSLRDEIRLFEEQEDQTLGNAGMEHISYIVKYAIEEDARMAYRLLKMHLDKYPKSELAKPWLQGTFMGSATFETFVQNAWFEIQQYQSPQEIARSLSNRLTLWMNTGAQNDFEYGPFTKILEFIDNQSNSRRDEIIAEMKKHIAHHSQQPQWLRGGLRMLVNNEKCEWKDTWLGDYVITILRMHFNSQTIHHDRAYMVEYGSRLLVPSPQTLWPELDSHVATFMHHLPSRFRNELFLDMVKNWNTGVQTINALKKHIPLSNMSTTEELRMRALMDVHHAHAIAEQEYADLQELDVTTKKQYLRAIFSELSSSMVLSGNGKTMLANCIRALCCETQEITNHLELWDRDFVLSRSQEMIRALARIYDIQVLNWQTQFMDPRMHAKLLCTIDTSLNEEKIFEFFEQYERQKKIHQELDLDPPTMTLHTIKQFFYPTEHILELD